MQQGINIEEVKKYNTSLRDYKEKSTKIRAELEFNEQELSRQCAELSKELGMQVTPDNVKDILADRIAKINNTMSVGNEILNRIQNEEASIAQINSGAMQPQQPGYAQTMAQAPQAPQAGFAQPPQVSAPTAPSSMPFDMSGGLPPIFAN